MRLRETALGESKDPREHEKIQSAITRYYNSLSDTEREEDREWGAFGESQFPEIAE
jgi:hypothetical protein